MRQRRRSGYHATPCGGKAATMPFGRAKIPTPLDHTLMPQSSFPTRIEARMANSSPTALYCFFFGQSEKDPPNSRIRCQPALLPPPAHLSDPRLVARSRKIKNRKPHSTLDPLLLFGPSSVFPHPMPLAKRRQGLPCDFGMSTDRSLRRSLLDPTRERCASSVLGPVIA